MHICIQVLCDLFPFPPAPRPPPLFLPPCLPYNVQHRKAIAKRVKTNEVSLNVPGYYLGEFPDYSKGKEHPKQRPDLSLSWRDRVQSSEFRRQNPKFQAKYHRRVLCRDMEIHGAFFSDYNIIKLEINSSKIFFFKSPNTWKLNNKCLNNPWVKKKVTRKVIKYF